MLKKRIIPTLLYNNFKLVKGTKFHSWRTVGSIMQAVKIYNIREVDELILLDVFATNNNKKIDLDLVNDVANECFMPLTFGGGINTIDDIGKIIKTGADKVSINSAAIKDIEFINKSSKIFGSQCIVVSIDYKIENGNPIIYSNSGNKKTELKLEDYIRDLESAGAGEILLTCIDRDGVMEGYDIETIKRVCKISSLPVIASGGCGENNHAYDLVKKTDVSAIGAASMYHFTHITPLDLKRYLSERKIPIRI